METTQQIVAKLNQSSNTLILVASDNGDSLASGLALKTFLTKLEKAAVVYTPAPTAQRFGFLPGLDQLQASIDLTKNLVIEVSVKKTPVAELSYKKTEDKLSIFLKPGGGAELTAEDVTFGAARFPYDLIILVGIQSLEQLGDFYNQHTALFFETPMVNIDFRANNENYGQFNLVQLSATSTSEIMFDLISKLEATLIDETVATQLLAGIIVETNSFQHIRTTPQTFLAASQLVTLGARQQEIVMNLYKTKSLGLLKLWGRVLASLKQDPDLNLVYATALSNDLIQAGANGEDADTVIKEMSAQLSFAKIFLFIKEQSAAESMVYIQSTLPLNLPQVFNQFLPQTLDPQTVKFKVNSALNDAETQILQLIAEQVRKFKST